MKRRRTPLLLSGHQLVLLQGGRELFPAMVQALDAASREVWLETYLFQFDVSGEMVAQALVRAAERGVRVRVVVDGVGCPLVPEAWSQRFAQAGVQWALFRPLGRLGMLIPSRWRRLHRKLCVVDGQTVFCGGINVLDDWDDPNHGPLTAPRLDFAVRVQGPLVSVAHELCTQFWWRLQAQHAAKHLQWREIWADLQQGLGTVAHAPGGEEGARAALVLRDNWRHRSRIERAYRKAIGEAQEEIIIANAYFLPGRKLHRGLIHAAQRGVKVRLLLQGRYEYFMQHHAVRRVYGGLLAAGVEIFEYEPSFLHAKVAVIDGHWATVGSSNLDPLSLLLAREANVVVNDAAFAADLRARLLDAMVREGRPVAPESVAQRPWTQRLLDAVAFVAMRGALFLTGSRY